MKNKDSLQIIFIRHAETDYADIGDRDPSDGELTARGEQQCIELGEKLKDFPIDAYITSSLKPLLVSATQSLISLCLKSALSLLNADALPDITVAVNSIWADIIKIQKWAINSSGLRNTNSVARLLRIMFSAQKK